jgi:hypothetical protein
LRFGVFAVKIDVIVFAGVAEEIVTSLLEDGENVYKHLPM